MKFKITNNGFNMNNLTDTIQTPPAIPTANQQNVDSSAQPPSNTTSKAHTIGIGVIILGVIVAVAVVAVLAVTGVGIAAIIAASVSMAVIAALKFGALAGVVVGLALTPLIVMAIKSCYTDREIPEESLTKLNAELEKELDKPLNDGSQAPKEGVFGKSDGFITPDAAESLNYKLMMIEKAQQSIEISANYFGGEAMNKVLNAIEKRCQEVPSLKVHVIANPEFLQPEDEQRLNDLRNKYEERFNFIITPTQVVVDSTIAFRDNHIKMVVIDEKYFVFGGSSIQDRLCSKGDEDPGEVPPSTNKILQAYGAKGYRDHDIVGRGALAKTLRAAYYRQFARWEYKVNREQNDLRNHFFPLEQSKECANVEGIDQNPRLVKNAKMKLVISNPESMSVNPCTKEYERVISEAKEMKIGNLYMYPASEIAQAMQKAAQAGAKITLLTNGVGENAPKQNACYTYLGRTTYEPLLDAAKAKEDSTTETSSEVEQEAIKIYEYAVPQITYHAKLMTAKSKDNVNQGIIGSYNFGTRSHETDDEGIIMFEDDKLVDQLNEIYDKDVELSKPISKQEAAEFKKDVFPIIFDRVVFGLM